MRRWAPILLLLTVIAGTTALYLPTLEYEAIWDTRDFLRTSVLLNQDRPLSEAFTGGYIYGQVQMTSQSIYYRPLVNLSFMLEKRLWGISPGTLRRTNLFLFIALILLVFAVLRAWHLAWPSALCATALFAVSPINPGNVVWIVGRGDLMMLMWSLLAILLLRRRPRGAWAVAGAWLAFVLALLSKETALFMIPLLFLADPPGLSRKQRVHQMGFILAGGAFLVVKHLILRIGSPALLRSASLWDYPLRTLAVTGHYTESLLLPFRPPLFQFVSEIETPFHMVVGALAGLALVACALWIFRSPQREHLRFPLALTGFFILPFILLSFTSMWPFRLSTRYMMTASLGIFWLLALGLEKISSRLRPVIVFALLLLFLPATLSHSQSHRDERTYWDRALEAHPGNPVLVLKLAETHYMNKNDLAAYALLKRGGEWRGRRLTAMHWKFLQAKLEAGRFRYPAALTLMDKAGPMPASMRFQSELLRARIEASTGDFLKAIARVRALVRQAPQRPEPHALLHLLLSGREEWGPAQKAEESARRVLGSRATWNTAAIRERCQRFSPLEKMGFYIQHLNFSRAGDSLQAASTLATLEDQLLLAWIEFQAGRESAANRRVLQSSTLFSSPGNMARIGQFFLEHLRRPETALLWYRRALEAREVPRWRKIERQLLQLAEGTPE